MPDRPSPATDPLHLNGDPFGHDGDSASFSEPPVRDAVFEDIELSIARRDWHAPSADAVLATTEPPPVVQVGDPFEESLDGADEPALDPDVVPPREPSLQYDEASGFQIDYGTEGAEPTATTALARVSRPRPVPAEAPARPSVPGPPGPPAPPRAAGRYAARDKARMLRRHKGLVIGLCLAGLFAGWLVSTLLPERFDAYSILLISPPREGSNGLNSDFVDAPGDDDRKMLNQALILQEAGDIPEQTAEALLALPAASSFSVYRGAESQFGAPVTPSKLAEYLQLKAIQVTPAREQVDAIRVQASAETATEAELIASIYTDEYLDLSQSTNRERLTATREIIEEQLARREGELSEIEQQLKRYMTSRNAAGLEAQTSATVGQIGLLQNQLDAARAEAQQRRAQLRQLEADLATVDTRLQQSAASAVTASPAQTQQLDAEIAQLEGLLSNTYLRNPELRGNPRSHPDVARIVDRLESLQQERRDIARQQSSAAVASGGLDVGSTGANGPSYLAELQRQISQERAALEGANARAATYAARLGEARGQLRDVPEQQVQIGQLQRQRDLSTGTVQRLAEELEKVRLAEDTELGIAQVIRAVQTPQKPSSPNLPLNMGLGGVLGFMLGLAGAAIRYRTDARVHTPDDLEEQGFSVVGTVPDLGASIREGRQEHDGASIDPALVTLTSPFSPQAEAFRHLHANLYTGAELAPEVVLVTAPESGTGKSVVATNLAIAAAQAGRRVLLVDADLRKPTVAGFLGLGDHPALGEGPEGTNLVYWSTTVPSLFAMTPRESAQTPDEMWAPHQVGELLNNLRTAFDLVIVDAPPALHAADAALLAPHADAALLVARSGASDLDALAQIANELAGVGLGRIGAVLNGFDARRAVGYARTAGVRQTAIRRV